MDVHLSYLFEKYCSFVGNDVEMTIECKAENTLAKDILYTVFAALNGVNFGSKKRVRVSFCSMTV